MRRAIVFGAGNIGRGFIGQLFSESDYHVTFVDIDPQIVDSLNRDRSYRLQTVFNEDVRECRVGPVDAIDGRDPAAVAAAIRDADIGATAVGANALPYLISNLVAGIGLRAARNAPPLNIILCENLKGAAARISALLAEQLPPEIAAYADGAIGFVDTVIGRMVPLPTDEMRHQDITLIRVEPYKELPVDKIQFKGEIPTISAMMPEDDFAVYTARKLYIHNCGHALLAYPGYLRGHTYGYEALQDPVVRMIMQGGLQESKAGIAASYGADPVWLQKHIEDLTHRFANRALGDTVFRLGRDPIRKLAPTDRLIGALKVASAGPTPPRFLALGVAAALFFDPPEDPGAGALQEQLRDHGVRNVLADMCGLPVDSPLADAVASLYRRLIPKPAERLEDVAADLRVAEGFAE